MKYKYLLLDHDDTIVDSTKDIHYASFLEVVNVLRPYVNISLEDFYRLNYDPGIIPLFEKVLGFTKEEMDYEHDHWKNYVKNHTPHLFDGVKDLLWDFVNKGGQIFVISHSYEHEIRRHYMEHGLPEPIKVYGFDYPENQRKPYTWPIEDIVLTFNLDKSLMLMVDDLKPGKTMAENSGVDFAAAGWAHDIKEIKEELLKSSKYFCKDISELRKVLEI